MILAPTPIRVDLTVAPTTAALLEVKMAWFVIEVDHAIAAVAPNDIEMSAVHFNLHDVTLNSSRFVSTTPAHHNSRTSLTQPLTAAAATMAGLINNVRPVGLPWRPLKLRLLELAQISRP